MRNCIILGSGRSGTSMLAGMLHGTGYFLGDRLLAPTPANPQGYFESHDVNVLNDELIASVVPVRPKMPLGCLFPWRLPAGLLWMASVGGDVEMRPSAGQLSRMRELTATVPFCLKDPRFCYTAGSWSSVLEDVVFLCVFREPGRTAASMRQDVRDRPYRGFHLTRGRALRVWTTMYERALSMSGQDGQWVFVHYDQILDGSALARIESAVEAKVDTSSIDPRLKRSHDDPHRLPLRTLEVYRRLCTLAGGS